MPNWWVGGWVGGWESCAALPPAPAPTHLPHAGTCTHTHVPSVNSSNAALSPKHWLNSGFLGILSLSLSSPPPAPVEPSEASILSMPAWLACSTWVGGCVGRVSWLASYTSSPPSSPLEEQGKGTHRHPNATPRGLTHREGAMRAWRQDLPGLWENARPGGASHTRCGDGCGEGGREGE